MLINPNLEKQLTQLNIYLRQGLAVFDQIFCSEYVEIKAGIDKKISSLSSISNVKIGSYSLLGSGDYRHACIGNYCTFAEGCKILDKRDYSFINSAMCGVNNHMPPSQIFRNFDQRQPTIKTTNTTLIGHDVWVGSNVKIKNGLLIGHGAKLEAGAVVKQHVPPYAIVEGNPARIVGQRFPQDVVERLLHCSWFNYDLQGLELQWVDIESCLSKISRGIAEGELPKLGKGYAMKVQVNNNFTIHISNWCLENELQERFGTTDMQEIFALPEIKAETVV